MTDNTNEITAERVREWLQSRETENNSTAIAEAFLDVYALWNQERSANTFKKELHGDLIKELHEENQRLRKAYDEKCEENRLLHSIVDKQCEALEFYGSAMTYVTKYLNNPSTVPPSLINSDRGSRAREALAFKGE